MGQTFSGEIKAKTVEVKFAIAGKVVAVRKFTGDSVNKGDLVASLDRKILQAELDQQLADYEKVRADFEIFNQKTPEPSEAIDKYLKTEKQAALNASVKEVEQAKAKLDQADLFSPVSGVVVDDSSIVPGLYVTPASSPIRIMDTSSFSFEFEIEQKDIEFFGSPREGKITFEGISKEVSGTSSPVFSDGKSFIVKIPLSDTSGLLPHLNGKANF